MTDAAFIYEAIRTPRSKGKADGSLNEVKPINLVTTLLDEMQSRLDLDTSRVDDMVLGCVRPVKEQGAVLPKVALQKAGWDESVPGAQVNRFCAKGRSVIRFMEEGSAHGQHFAWVEEKKSTKSDFNSDKRWVLMV